jgi:hypothetical protein
VLERVGVLPLAPGEVLLRPVVPSAGERLAVRELPDAVEARPVPEPGHQILFDHMSQNILPPRDLRLLLVADRNRLVALLPDLGFSSAPPSFYVCGLPRETGSAEAGSATLTTMLAYARCS